MKIETERQAQYHQTLANQIRTELESPAAAFHSRQLQHKKQYQAPIEKEFKNKQAQEAHVTKAREKYEADCMRINSYTAQSSLVQGKDLEKITVKLERAQQTVQVNEKEFCNFAKILQETTLKWEQSWKNFCDNCQDMEEQRLEFMKDNLWAYANAVSTVCSCEKVRLALEQMEPEREMENFVRDYGTGNEMPNPPQFVNYNTPDAIPSSAIRPTTRPASFARSSTRELLPRETLEPIEDAPPVNTAGVGAGGGMRQSVALDPAALQRQDTRRNSVSPVNGHDHPYANGTSQPHQPVPSPEPPAATSPFSVQRKPTVSTRTSTSASTSRFPHDPLAEPIDPNAETYIKVGNSAYKVDLTRDPQQQLTIPTNRSAPASPVKSSSPMKQDGSIDPLQKQLQELQNVVSSTGSARRNTLHSRAPPEQKSVSPAPPLPLGISQPTPNPVQKSLSPPVPNAAQRNRSPSPNRDYRNSADVVVGAHPSAPSPSRPVSPNPPTAAFMVPPPSAEVQPPGVAWDTLVSGLMVGLEATVPFLNPEDPVRAPNASRNTLVSPAHNIARAPSPNSVGIALDPNGRVMHDELAHGYQQQQAHRQSQPPPQQQRMSQQPAPRYNPSPAPSPQQQPPQRRNSYAPPAVSPAAAIAPPQGPQHYAVTPPPPPPANAYQPGAPAPQPAYAPPGASHPTYTPPSQLMYQQQQQPAAPQQPMHGYQNPANASRNNMGYNVSNKRRSKHTLNQVINRHNRPNNSNNGLRELPQQHTVLFYVKALYDYAATIDEEFDFQAGDIIAVTSTPEDGWWTGELLDEARRQPGRNVFPSNFVCLF
ncbi:hypothetical protein EST38_g857 [Candolleomyces aberdarensis]|uniref:SH3 domain-containing protein n=1 Tax=Candolleomyces aberdarensis TaxID=2316362 RepID=A0A4Q2DXL2_9AGAR|nr:hypothetical protein EST38_g857 [Candolleomyces aberdarensis]